MKVLAQSLGISLLCGGLILLAAFVSNLFNAGMTVVFGPSPASDVLLVFSDFVLSNAVTVFIVVAVGVFVVTVIAFIRDPKMKF